MRLMVNGRPNEVKEGMTLSGLLANMKLDHLRVAVELNGQVVPRRDFDTVTLREGDSMEVVTLVGGG